MEGPGNEAKLSAASEPKHGGEKLGERGGRGRAGGREMERRRQRLNANDHGEETRKTWNLQSTKGSCLWRHMTQLIPEGDSGWTVGNELGRPKGK